MKISKSAQYGFLAVVGLTLVAYMAVTTIFRSSNPPQVFFTPEETNQTGQTGDPLEAVKAVNTVGGGIVSHLDTQENRVVASLGLTDALALYAAGAQQQVKEQMLSVMAVGAENHTSLGALNRRFIGGASTQIYRASGFWADRVLRPEESFIALNGDYRTRFEVLDMSDFAKASKTVNDYIADASKGKLEMEMESIRPKSTMILVGADAFYGKLKGLKKMESPLTFTGADGQQTQMEGVTGTIRATYYEDEHVRYAALPLQDGYQLEVALPKGGIAEFAINHDKLVTYRARAAETSLEAALPVLDLKTRVTVGGALEQLGMEKLMTQQQKIKGVSSGYQMMMNRVDSLCRLRLDPDEAASSGKGETAFTLDQPFYFAVTEQETGASFVSGKMVK